MGPTLIFIVSSLTFQGFFETVPVGRLASKMLNVLVRQQAVLTLTKSVIGELTAREAISAGYSSKNWCSTEYPMFSRFEWCGLQDVECVNTMTSECDVSIRRGELSRRFQQPTKTKTKEQHRERTPGPKKHGV